MEKKKNPKADLEKSRSIFFLIGLMVALGAVFAAFNHSTRTSNVEILAGTSEIFFEEDEVLQIPQDDKKEIIQPKQQQVIDIISIVDDTEETTDLPIFDSEADGETEVDFTEVVPLKEEVDNGPDIPIDFASKMPVFPGGETGLMNYISKKTVYPSAARDQGIEGKVYVRFCVTKYGTVDRVSIARSADPLLDKEALRVVKLLPKWQPGENGGRKVSVWYFVPINFKLN
jgi:periplasmic protein TonB